MAKVVYSADTYIPFYAFSALLLAAFDFIAISLKPSAFLYIMLLAPISLVFLIITEWAYQKKNNMFIW